MPLVIVWGIGSLAVGAGVKFLGDGIEDSGKGIRDIAIAGALVGGVYFIAKNQGLIK